jgi:hypothetical protein
MMYLRVDLPQVQLQQQSSSTPHRHWNDIDIITYYTVAVGDFKPWQPPHGALLAPPLATKLTPDAQHLFDEMIRQQKVPVENLIQELKKLKRARQHSHSITNIKSQRIEKRKIRYKDIIDLDCVSDKLSESIKKLLLEERFKFFKFYENVRPPYFGSLSSLNLYSSSLIWMW